MYESEEVHEIAVYMPNAEESRWRVVLCTNCDGICDDVATEHVVDEAAAKEVAGRWQSEHDVLTLMLARESPEEGRVGAMIQSMDFVELDEPWQLPDDAVLYKDEGECGPVHVRRGGDVTNYEDHPELKSPVSGKPTARWFTRDQAAEIAEREGLPLEEG